MIYVCQHCKEPVGYTYKRDVLTGQMVEEWTMDAAFFDGELAHAACVEAAKLLDKVEGKKETTFINCRSYNNASQGFSVASP